MRPLDGITVPDLGHSYQGLVYTAILSVIGAEVINVDPPGEHLQYRNHTTEPPEVEFMNPGMRGIVLNQQTDAGK